MREVCNKRTGAVFFVESDEERANRKIREEYAVLKKALCLLLKKYPGPLPLDVQQFLDGGFEC